MNFKSKKFYIGLFFSALLIYLIIHQLDFSEMAATFKKCNPKMLLLAVPVYFLSYITRAIRWKYLMMGKENYKVPTLMGIIFIGYILNSFLPARIGDFYRAYLAGEKFGTSKVTVFSSIVLERILDGIVVLSMLLLSILFFFHQPWMYKLAFSVAALFGGSFILVYCLFKYSNTDVLAQKLKNFCLKYPKIFKDKFINFLDNIHKHIKSFITGFEVVNSPKNLSISLLATACGLTIETFFILIIIHSFSGLSIGFPAALLTMCLGVFSALIPSVSVHAGPYQYAFILGLGAYGVSKEIAITIALTTQFLMISFIVICGLIALVRYHIGFDNIKDVGTKLDKKEN